MKRFTTTLVALLIGIGFSTPAHPTLINRGGGLVYDDVLNITWLQDANYAATSGHDADGQMLWADAMTWAENLNYQGYHDWRLPSTLGQPYSGYYPNLGGTGEMGKLYYTALGNTMDNFTNPGPFLNIQSGWYWAQDHRDLTDNDPYDYFSFNFAAGNQGFGIDMPRYAWAIRDGDSTPVPEPSTIFLLGIGLAGAMVLRKRLIGK